VRRDEAQRLLAGLQAGYERIAAAMFAIDGHPGQVLLRDTTLTGATEARAAALRPEVDLLWAHFALLGNLLTRAGEICAARRPGDGEWAELERLLREPVVALDAGGLPLDGPGTAAARLRLRELAEQVERRCAGVTDHLSEVDTAWTVVAGRLARASEAVDALVALAGEVGQPEAAAAVRRGLAEIARLDAADPLSAAPGGRISGAAGARFDRLDADVAAVRARLGQVGQVRDGYPARAAAIRALVDEVARAEQAAAQAYRRVAEKIAEPGLAPLPAAADVLRGRLAGLDRLYRGAQWDRLAADAAVLEESARRAAARAAELGALADGLVERRDELRGRLAAYREKAARHGLAEEETLTDAYGRAHALLFTAPCDLRGATRAVYAYQQALSGLVTGGAPAGEPVGRPESGGLVDD
jgi:hypothetical protein